jgi:hypothetical protein
MIFGLFSLNFFVGNTQSLIEMANDSKAYKEVMAMTTLNVNKIIAGYEDGMTIYYNPDYSSNRKVIFSKIDSGRKDYEGNAIYHVRLTDAKTNDTVILVPKWSFYPTSYSPLKLIHSSEPKAETIGGYYEHEYYTFDINRRALYSSSSTFALKPIDQTMCPTIKKKLEYDRQDLFKETEEKQYLGYTAMIDAHYKSMENCIYQDEFLKCIKGDYVYFGSGNGSSSMVKLKIKKVFNGSELIEIILIKPFVDGSYPEKEEFYIRAKKDNNGFLRFNSKDVVSIEDKQSYHISPGILVPFNGVVVCMNDSYNGYSSKAGSYTFSKYKFGAEQIAMVETYDLFEYPNSTGFQTQWVLKNVTSNYDNNNLYDLCNYISYKLLPLLLK